MKISIKHIVVPGLSLFFFSACGKKTKELTPAEVRAKADSIVMTKLPKLRKEAAEDLQRRLPIEIKPKVDSILNVNHNPEAVPVFPEDNIGVDNTSTDTTKKQKGS